MKLFEIASAMFWGFSIGFSFGGFVMGSDHILNLAACCALISIASSQIVSRYINR